MTNLKRLRWIYFLCHIGMLGGFFIGSAGWWLLSVGVYLVLQVVGVGIGLHRYLAHRSFTTGSLRHRLLLLVATLSAMGSPISWAAIHRYHHQTADTDDDPHNFRQLGVGAVLLGNYNEDVRIPKAMLRDLVEDRFARALHEYYFLILAGWGALLLVFGLKVFIFGFCVPIVLVYWATALGIVLNHAWGYRNFETNDKSVNSWLLSMYTLGDGWHNNHHRHPSLYSHQVRWWEFDLCAYLIRFVFRRKIQADPS